MLIGFRFKNYRSFRDETILSLTATGFGPFKDSLIQYEKKTKLLPSVAIYGKNGGGKSNVVRAFWTAVQFIRNSRRTQHEKAEIPVAPFNLNDYSEDDPTEFNFIYTVDGVKYRYGFAATQERIVKEYLYHAPKGWNALVFSRDGQKFNFADEKSKRIMIGEMVAKNQLFLSVACTMNDASCIKAMSWFRERIFFSRDYSDIPRPFLECSADENTLKAIASYAKAADLGIEDIQFEFNGKAINKDSEFFKETPEGIGTAFTQFVRALSDTSRTSEMRLRTGAISARTVHQGENRNGQKVLFSLDISEESDGARKLMALAPAVEATLRMGGVLLVDELDRSLHTGLVNFLVSKFQNKATNPNGAQMIFTTNNIELMNMDLLRKDQVYFADKSENNGASELYGLRDFNAKETGNIRKSYLTGKYGATPNLRRTLNR